MSNRRKYCIVEHIWRALRALFLAVGTGLWLYTTLSPHIIMACFLGALFVDQAHGLICSWIEKALKWKQQHNKWD